MAEGELIVVRCTSCGDTFTIHTGDRGVCPSCGGTDHDLASEPLL